MKHLITFFTLFLIAININFSQTFDEQLVIVANDGTNFSIAVQVKGNSLPAAKTLNSTTIDVNYDNSILTFTGASNWIVSSGLGYARSATNNTTFVRIIITGTSVGNDGPGDPAGYDVTTSYATWVQLNFTHSNPSSSVDLTIAPGSNSISLFNNPNNNPNTGTNTAYPTIIHNLSDQPLPVELSSFKVNAVEGTKAQLNWETANEVNNYGFEIERSLKTETVKDMPETESKWEKVGFVKGNGNSNSTKIYSFTDKNLVGGSKFLYRLKQIDIDGKFEYSEVVEIEVLPVKYELMQNYPNPFNPNTNIKFSLPEDAKVSINVYNVLGEKVASVLNEDLKAGFHQVNFSANSFGYQFASGIYLYTIESKNFTQVKKMILIK